MKRTLTALAVRTTLLHVLQTRRRLASTAQGWLGRSSKTSQRSLT